ncbi:unnamed protein product [Closterium sp. NIES-53]
MERVLPPRWTVARDVAVGAEQAKAMAILELASRAHVRGSGVSFSLDICSSENHKAWIAFTGHLMTKEWELAQAVFNFREMPTTHDAASIEKLFGEMLAKWGLVECCHGLTTNTPPLLARLISTALPSLKNYYSGCTNELVICTFLDPAFKLRYFEVDTWEGMPVWSRRPEEVL